MHTGTCTRAHSHTLSHTQGVAGFVLSDKDAASITVRLDIPGLVAAAASAAAGGPNAQSQPTPQLSAVPVTTHSHLSGGAAGAFTSAFNDAVAQAALALVSAAAAGSRAQPTAHPVHHPHPQMQQFVIPTAAPKPQAALLLAQQATALARAGLPAGTQVSPSSVMGGAWCWCAKARASGVLVCVVTLTTAAG